MVYCVAFNCKRRSGKGISLFEFPKDEKRRKAWIVRVKRENFNPLPTARLCAKHFTNDQFVVNPLTAASIGYKMKKLQLKNDAEPTIFDYSKKGDLEKRKTPRSSGAFAKRMKLETLSEILVEEHGKGDNCQDAVGTTTEHAYSDTTCYTAHDTATESILPSDVHVDTSRPRYNIFTQTLPVEKRSFGCQVKPEMFEVGVQTTAAKSTSLPSPTLDLEDIGEDFNIKDNEHDDPDWAPCQQTCSDTEDQEREMNVAQENKFIVFESCLRKLLKCMCAHCGNERDIVKFQLIGTGLSVLLQCRCLNLMRWDSQPFSGTMPLGNLILAGAVLFSGNSISKILTFFRHASISCFSERTYSSIQSCYLIPTITDIWQIKQLDLITEIQRNGSKVKIGGDARCCTPGHTAKYGSYSIMDLERNKVIDTQLVQSNEVPNSYHMELEGLKRCFAFLDDNDIAVVNLVTDRHPSVKKYMRLEKPDVNHLFDVWHVAKGVYKKLEQIGKKKTKGFAVIGRWAKSASNHIYWCAASSHGDAEMVQQKWQSILNHVANIHEGHGPKFPRCEHDAVDDREWIKKDGKAYQAMETVVCGKTLLKDIGKLSPAEQTSSLESYHRVVCFFAPKSVHYMHAQMEARLYLAGLHFNENSCRPQAITSEGKSQYRVSFPKSRRGEGVAKEVKVEPTYGYIQDLFEDLLFRRERLGSYSEAAQERKNTDKQRPLPLSYSTPHRPKDEIVQSHRSRFNKD